MKNAGDGSDRRPSYAPADPGTRSVQHKKRPERSARVVCPDGRQGSGMGSSIVLLPSFALSSNKISVSDVLGFSFFTESVK
jgi:hypothetical protein